MNKLLLITLLTTCYTVANADDVTKAVTCDKQPLSVKWYRDSAEKNALYREIFQLSKTALITNKKHLKSGTACGTIFDIDETIIDNSQYAVENSGECTSFQKDTWDKFVNSEVSTALPGAVDITHYIHSIGCKVNLVTNRPEDEREATIAVLKKNNIYFDQLILAKDLNDKDKTPRFNAIINGKAPSQIKQKQTIIAYYGDNIQDFPNIKQSNYIKEDSNGKAFNQFGTNYFVLPNPTYGSWMNNPYK